MTIKTATKMSPAVSYAAASATLASIAERLMISGTAASLDALSQNIGLARHAFQQYLKKR